MATPLKNKYYKSGDLYFASPYSQGDVYGTELSREQFITDVGAQIQGYQARGLQEGTGYSSALAESLRAAQADTPSGYVTNLATGRPQTLADYQRGTPEGQAAESALAAKNLAYAQSVNAPQAQNVDTRYFLQPGETIEKYNARLASFNLPSGATAIGTPAAGNITAASLSGGATPTYKIPSQLPDTGITGLGDFGATPQEKKISGEITDIRKQREQLLGETEFRQKEEEARGIPGLARLQQDLSSQLKLSQLDAANIQAQTQQAGSGVTTVIDQRQRAEALRLNSVKSLQIYAQLEMAKGNLSTAQDAADRAVELKFGPVKERIQIAKDNLELLIADPSTSRQDKARAQAQLAVQNEKERAIKKQESDEQDKDKLLFAAMQNGLTDSLIISQVNKGTKEQAEQLLAPYMQKATPENVNKPMSLSQLEQFRRSYGWTPPLGFTQTQLEQYIADNPNATPEELEAGARQVSDEVSSEEKAPNDSTPDQIISFIVENMNDAQKSALKNKVDAAGVSSMWKSASIDIDIENYLDSIRVQIQEALDAGYTQEEILAHLAS